MTSNRTVFTLLAVALLVVLAGCAGGIGGNDAQEAQRDQATGGGDAATGTQQDQVLSRYENGTRIVVRTGDIRLQVQEYETAFTETRQIAREHGGFLADWDHSTEGDWDRGRIRIRVPATEFAETRDALTELGTVEHESVRHHDFTAEYVDTEQRISQLEAQRERMETLYNDTEDTDERREILTEINEITDQINRLEGDVASIERRQAFSTIEVTLREPESKKPPRSYETAYGFGDAFTEAFYGGLTLVKYVVVLFGYFIPGVVSLVIVGVVGLLGFRGFQYARFGVDSLLPDPPSTGESSQVSSEDESESGSQES